MTAAAAARRARTRLVAGATERYRHAVLTRSRTLPAYLAAAELYGRAHDTFDAAVRARRAAGAGQRPAGPVPVDPLPLVTPRVSGAVASALLRWDAAAGTARLRAVDGTRVLDSADTAGSAGELHVDPRELPTGRWHVALDSGAVLGFAPDRFPPLAGVPAPDPVRDGGSRLDVTVDDANRLVLHIVRPVPA